ncbi:MAG: hypothetical protein HY817_00100 [Candidatus Abawacabacteria bacterium]|nr:hypothetical protein [Candidatus Abawacabacteria bacterium]
MNNTQPAVPPDSLPLLRRYLSCRSALPFLPEGMVALTRSDLVKVFGRTALSNALCQCHSHATSRSNLRRALATYEAPRNYASLREKAAQQEAAYDVDALLRERSQLVARLAGLHAVQQLFQEKKRSLEKGMGLLRAHYKKDVAGLAADKNYQLLSSQVDEIKRLLKTVDEKVNGDADIGLSGLAKQQRECDIKLALGENLAEIATTWGEVTLEHMNCLDLMSPSDRQTWSAFLNLEQTNIGLAAAAKQKARDAAWADGTKVNEVNQKRDAILDQLRLDEANYKLAHGMMTHFEKTRALLGAEGVAKITKAARDICIKERINVTKTATKVVGKVEDQIGNWSQDLINPILMVLPPSAPRERLETFAIEIVEKAATALCRIMSNTLIEEIDFHSAQELFKQLVYSLLFPGYRGEMIVGFGGTESPVSPRYPAYLLAPLQVIETLIHLNHEWEQQGEGVTINIPDLVLLDAHEPSGQMNGMNLSLTAQRASESKELLVAFVERFFPRCAPYLKVQEAKASTEEDATLREIQDHVLQLAIGDKRDKVLDECMEELIKRAQDHAKQPISRDTATVTAARYVALHPRLFREIRTAKDKFTSAFSIKFGGAGERAFNSLQRKLTMSGKYNVHPGSKTFVPHAPIHITMVAGAVPPYYPLAEEPSIDQIGEVSVIEAFRNLVTAGDLKLSKTAAVVRDMRILLETVSPEEYIALLMSLKKGKRQEEFVAA